MQGNAEDIIHGKNDQLKGAAGFTSPQMKNSVNASLDQSNISAVDVSIMTNDFNEIN